MKNEMTGHAIYTKNLEREIDNLRREVSLLRTFINSGHHIDVEAEKGKPISYDDWIERPDGFCVLRPLRESMPDTKETDKEEFDKDVSKISLLRYTIEKWFGERCSEYEETCECCRRWRLYDNLLENPFND